MSVPAMASSGAATAASATSGADSGAEGGLGQDPAFDAGGGGDGGEPLGTGEAAEGGAQAPPAAPYRFGQREWPSQERAEREFLTNIGRLQSVQRRNQELEQMVADLRGAMQRGGPAGAPGAEQGDAGAGEGEPTPEEAALFDIDSLDWQLISGAYRERGPEVGMYLLAQQLVNGIAKGLDGRMTKALEPLNSLRDSAGQSATVARLWQGAQDATGQDGALLFPELSTPNEAYLVHDIWRQITDGMPPEVAAHPRMVRSAVLEYRALKAASGDNQASDDGSGANAEDVAAHAVGAMRGAARATGVLPTQRPTTPTAARRKPQTEEERIKQSLLSAGQESGSLGFRR